MSTLSSESSYNDGVTGTTSGFEGESAGRGATFWNGAVAGGLAGLVASAAMIWAGNAWGGSILPQLIAERTTAELPLAVLRDILQNMEENAKPTSLIGITIGQVIVAALGAALYARFARPTPRARLLGGLAVAVIAWLVLSVIVAPLGNVGVFALESPLGTSETQAAFMLAAALYGGLVALLVPWPALDIAEDPGRRSLLRTGGLAALALPALAAAGYIGRQANDLRTAFDTSEGVRDEDGDSPFETARMPQFITPNPAFYVVSKNIVDPAVNSNDWDLVVDGMVDNPLTLSYSDIQLRKSRDFTSTLECISNFVGGDLISNTVWTGFPMADLLNEAGLQDGVVDLKLHAADGYTESIPLDKGLQPDVMLVHSMGGEPLTEKHGYPLRLIVPNIFGMKNVKWITRIEAVNEDYQGFWQERDWSDDATVVTMSRIDIPRTAYKAKIGETVRLGGVAFAGSRGVSKVEVSLDQGITWHEAQLSEVPSNLTWRLWVYDYEATELGVKRISVRATDGNGELQTSVEQPPLPDGATGYDRDWFEVLDETGASVDLDGETAHKAGARWLYGSRVNPFGAAKR